jgi:hypothetical protein
MAPLDETQAQSSGRARRRRRSLSAVIRRLAVVRRSGSISRMLSVIVTRGNPTRLAGLLAALTEAAVEGLVRDVTLLTGDDPQLLDALCDATGANLAEDLAQAVAQARSDWLLIAPPELRLKDGWVERLSDHLRDGGGEARLTGLGEGFLRPGPQGVLVGRAKAQASAQGGLQRLARQLGRGARRLG